MKLQQTKDYLLLIDEEVEIKDGDICIDSAGVIFKHENHLPISIGQRKITAYRPLTKEAKELDLPLLPNPFEVDDFQQSYKVVYDYVSDGIRNYAAYVELLKLKKIAQSKQFSLEDVVRIVHLWDNHINIHEEDKGCIKEIEKFIQSLSTQKLPSEFTPEYEYVESVDDLWEFQDDDSLPKRKLKTITNSEGKQELVGIYKY